MEVVGHDLRTPTSGLDRRGVDLVELLGIDGVVVLLGNVRAELGGPVNPP